MTPTFSLYIHWPFCESKCPYCDFNSHVLRTITEDMWIDAIIHEMTRTRDLMEPRTLCSVFFGGGTPSLMSPEAVAAVINAATTLWQTTPNLEISMEANPGSVEAARFRGYQQAGVNRLSLGIQALNDADLNSLGRKHSVTEALKALEIAQNTFDRVSFDLIYARMNQTLDAWKAELATALSFGTEHLSLYQLTIEPGTAFAPLHKRGELVIPEENEAYHLFQLTQEMTEAAGLPGYEVSNHARLGKECQHNLTYWNYGDYVGVGPGAHGRIHLTNSDRVATQQIKAPELWHKSVSEKGTGDQSVIELTSDEQFKERLLMGLRLKTGITISSLGREFTELEQNRLLTLRKEELLMPSESLLQLTAKGTLVQNAVLAYMLGD
ncbi:MAG: radical SAM family heme chaperone HemW [Pseudomonadota bacterium]|nr:radical SAM family heme chaperone HemW [Alphaproteobacteria bacterium]MDP5369958.1 radical SAM family heme chaperone HemW [Pseudomonadota bacterium]